ncbi:rhodanese-like domain-containing protein [Pseudodesulfovibrio sediminis]|uniref:Sulfurtransferase n=1 Tax=Pseudodesulfovibrio sediminis TaxID=2810563 RepID=A0ABN6ENN1_9BACT|nr:rhodanese-like domain-containing protein [Pseudodesulfovibrio sediminis]BCS87856.1 sulfurtransferase [Pseudodesulfovibrio sediminis]
MKTPYLILVVIVLVASAFLYLNLGSPQPEGFVNLTAEEAQANLSVAHDVQIIDIRTPAEYVDGHLEGAVNIDFYSKTFVDELKKLDPEKRYFIYCRTGNRSSNALRKMDGLGFTHVWHLKNGIVDWQRSGLPLVR